MMLPNTGLAITGDVIENPTGTYSILGTNSYSNYVQSGPHDWTNNEAIVEVVTAPTTTNYETTFQARNPTNSSDEVSIQIRNGYVRFRQDNGQLAQLAYTPGTAIWFRLSHEGSDIAYYTSADGAVWTERHRAVAAFNVSSSNLRIFANCTDGGTERSVVRNINGTPDTENPTAPTSLNANVSNSDVTLTWTIGTDNVGIDHHEVHRSQSDGFVPGSGTVISDTVLGSANTYSDADLSNGTYYYKVISVDGYGNKSTASNQATAVVNVVPASGFYKATDGSAVELLKYDGASWA